MKKFFNNQNFYVAITQKPIWTLVLITLFINCFASFYNIFYANSNEINYNLFRRCGEAVFINFIFIVFIFYLFYLTKFLLKPFAYFIVFVSVFAFLLDVFLIDKFYTFFTIQIFESILNTNFNEASEFASSFLDFRTIFIVLATFFAIFLISKIKPFYSKKFIIFINSIILLSFIGIVAATINYYFKKHKANLSRATRFPVAKIFLVPFQYFSQTGLGSTKILISNFKDIEEKEGNLSAKNGVKNIILIIGESNARKYTGIYNDTYKTTPKIESLPNKIVFSDAVSVASSTPENLRHITTLRKNPKWSDNLNLISLFKNSGYKTFWISNQESNGIYTSGSFAASELADKSFYTNKYAQLFDYKGAKFDGELAKVAREFSQNIENGLYVFHFVGSHFTYNKRYPANFGKFTSEDIKENLPNDRKITKSEYLNSVLYTDFVINEIYKIFENKDALILYLSDHGESLWDFKDKVGHGFTCKETAEIPFIAIATNDFIQNHSEIWKNIEKSKNLPFHSPNMADLLCDIAGINSKWCESKRSIINENYNANFVRLIDGKDYKSLE